MVNNREDRLAVAIPAADGRWSATVPNDVEYAVKSGDEAAVSQHLRSGGDVNARTIYQSQMLHVAARNGQAAIVSLLLKAPGVEINALDYGGMRRTALHWACQRGDVRSVEALVSAGADTKIQGATWQKLVQGRACGRLVPSNSPTPEAPEDLCRNRIVQLALLRPPWSPAIHSRFPARFRDAAKLLMLVAHYDNSASCHDSSPIADSESSVQQVSEPVPGLATYESKSRHSDCSDHDCLSPSESLQSNQPIEQTVNQSASWPLTSDLTRVIIAAAAYPISAWSHD